MWSGASEPMPSLCREPSQKTSSPPQLVAPGGVFSFVPGVFAFVFGRPSLPAREGRRLRRGQGGSHRNKNSARGRNGTVCCFRASGGRNFRASARRNFRVSGGRNLEAPSFADHPTPSHPFPLDPQYAPFSPPPALASLALSIELAWIFCLCLFLTKATHFDARSEFS